jgi:hypothetical protein
MVPAIKNIFSFDKKMFSGIKNIFFVTQIIFMTWETTVAASKKTVSVAFQRRFWLMGVPRWAFSGNRHLKKADMVSHSYPGRD